MKLPSKKILRIRQTIYEDPGNPFAHDQDSEMARDLAEADEHVDSSDFHNHQGQNASQRSVDDIQSLEDRSAAFDGPPPHFWAKRPVNLAHRRSQSVAIPQMPCYFDDVDEYIAPRRFWRSGSMPADQAAQSPNSVRDTKFYGFYDDILYDYKDRTRRV